MYHFVADHPPVPVRLSFRALIPGHVRQYLKQFQIDAIQFMHNFLAKGEFCVYNDESGLGKQAAIAVLLDAACGNKKSLIVVQNDDVYVHGWEFHFNVLTNCNVTVIKDGKDSTDSPHNIYITKWSTLRGIDDLSKFDFDYIILDNRGQMLNNSFCMSMLLKHYERKINILISSVDITSDLKLLHNVLKLGGRLDPRYASFKQFEDKFKLPDAKELTYKKVDLEDYFLKRERLADYCKNFRLRRYCHQYEQQLPLVEAGRYKINLDIYREKQNATNSEGSSVEVSSQNRQDERVRDTQELFEEYCRQRRKQQELEKQKKEKEQQKEQQQQQQKLREQRKLEEQQKLQKECEVQTICDVDDEVAFINETPPPRIVQDKRANSRDNSDEAVVMSPLLLVSDSEDIDDVPQICNDPNDDTDVVDLSSDEEHEEIERIEAAGITEAAAVIEAAERSETAERTEAAEITETADRSDEAEIIELTEASENIINKDSQKENKKTDRSERSEKIINSQNDTDRTARSEKIINLDSQNDTERSEKIINKGSLKEADKTKRSEKIIHKNSPKEANSTERSEKTEKTGKYRNEIDRLKADVATNLKFQNETTPKRRTRHADEKQCLVNGKRRGNEATGRTTPNEAKDAATGKGPRKDPPKETVVKEKEIPLNTATNKKNKNCAVKEIPAEKTGKPIENDKRKNDKSSTKDENPKNRKSAETDKGKVQKVQENESKNEDKTTPRLSRASRQLVHDSVKNSTATPLTTRTRRSPANNNKSNEGNITPATPNLDIVIKKEPPEYNTPTTKRSLTKEMCSTIKRIKRELNVEQVLLHNKETRSAKRSTRSATCPGKNSENAKNALFNKDNKPSKPKKVPQDKQENKTETKQQNPTTKNSKTTEKKINDTQAPIIAMTCSQDYEPIQCAQRLSDVSAFENDTQRKTSEFLIPPTPVSTRNSLIPSSLNSFFGESEVIFVPPTPPAGGKTSSSHAKANKKEDVIILSESDNENSSSLNLSATSRRTRALKPRRVQKTTPEEASSKVPTFSQLLAKHSTRTSAKSPDLFSNCSDLAQLPCSQTPANVDETNAPFEGFKIFGSEVKQLQQHYALSKTQNFTSNGKNAYRDRSCLDILENMFEPTNKKQKNKSADKSKSKEDPKSAPTQQSPRRPATQKAKVHTPIVPQHPIEAIAEAKAQQEKRSRSLASSSVNEDEIFEITNNGTFGSVMRLHNGEVSPVHPTQKSLTQNNKITKYFQGGLAQNITGSQEDSGNNSEAGTPSKKQQQQHQMTSTQYANLKKSPKQKCSSTQITKLTKWFTKNTPTKQIQTQVSKRNSASPSALKQSTGKRSVKRRRLNLTPIRSDSD